MVQRVYTGCHNCKRCTNSAAAEFGRKQGKLWLNLATAGGAAAVQAFTADCRACGHKLSLHDRGGEPQGNSYPAPVFMQPAPPQPMPAPYMPAPPPPQGPPPGWYPDQQIPQLMRWWDGTRWTEHTQQGGLPPALR